MASPACNSLLKISLGRKRFNLPEPAVFGTPNPFHRSERNQQERLEFWRAAVGGEGPEQRISIQKSEKWRQLAKDVSRTARRRRRRRKDESDDEPDLF